MAGIDDIGGQVIPQGEDAEIKSPLPGMKRNGEFFHFMLGRLASSAAAIEPRKQGRAMCEIFGNYGWAEGVALEKYLADHFMVRGVNWYVPHAFSPKRFPDPDCPPHFYAHGNHPQYRHFGCLMKYMNRVCSLISAGNREAQAALVYHAEAEWQGIPFTPNEKMARKLEESQVSFDIVPRDFFDEPGKYADRSYRTVIGWEESELPQGLTPVASFEPKSAHLRAAHFTGGSAHLYYFVNEAAGDWRGRIRIPQPGPCFAYNAWDNRLEPLIQSQADGETVITALLEPRKSLLVLFAEGPLPDLTPFPDTEDAREIELSGWTRSVCRAADYPDFTGEKPVQVPEDASKEMKKFSGFLRYRTSFEWDGAGALVLTVDDAAEGVEVFVNGVSAGIQVVPVFRYDLTELARTGTNELIIEVATTLERACYPPKGYSRLYTPKPSSGSGLTGRAALRQCAK